MNDIQEVSRSQVRLGYDTAADGAFVEYQGGRYLSGQCVREGWIWITWSDSGQWFGIKSSQVTPNQLRF
ncbi:hypothetical protein [Ectothiorhodospira shaposhnikovii]|uniref:hypothetical protein n=1 Tax=Ectothiorhodospira shaposhnikovii TaxID=1054 RepID=UPI0019063837|nr:hypothetical protein [Ectothiorhodospira shaposhnikovii]MBK1674719.1 hypothetical protein [Ectothiorhodospira shaposhnikovii]